MDKIRVLFICGHNSGRSQIAEAFLKKIGGEKLFIESAGLEPKPINPLVVEVMQEIGYDLSEAKADSVFEFFKEGRLYDYVITVCDETAAGQCPVFPGITKRFHWPFKDPEDLTGTHAEMLADLRIIRDQIQEKVSEWFKTVL
ncbi:arsenate reductase [Alkalispirochaeta odontotermitis]|nr:arsenate reductase [Alkalispirochaeta odontotermitis]CAB1083987.1 Arsenate reductase (EC thioredoxin-coupled, LMWP family [Olavius algarvensis Delta 1 endosymbiont]